jgi:putative hydrolase of the HAD superfamily
VTLRVRVEEVGTEPPAVEGIVLDVGGVLLLPDPAVMREQLAPFGVSPSDDQCVHAHYVGMAAIDELGIADFTHANRSIAEFLGVERKDQDEAVAAVESAYGRAFVPIAGVAKQLGRLRAAGVAIAVVSNATGTVEERLAELGICAVGGSGDLPEVAVVVDSAVVGLEKPDPAIFGFALEALDLAPERCMYVGDSVHFDVNGAVDAGLRPVHLTALTGCDGGHPHYRTLSDFVDAFLGGPSNRLGAT